MKLKIKVTKDIIRKAMWCGTDKAPQTIGENSSNCAIALAVRDIFPHARVGYSTFLFNENKADYVYLDSETTYFIQSFDSYVAVPEKRLELPEYEFEVDLPDNVVDQINISDIHKSKTLEVAV